MDGLTDKVEEWFKKNGGVKKENKRYEEKKEENFEGERE
jgi:hypothetical protein